MDWNRSDTLALATQNCAVCKGDGLRITPIKGEQSPCNCVLRNIFRACYHRFRVSVNKEPYVSKVTLENCSGRGGRRVWARKTEEYIADFCLVSRRALNDAEHQIFRFHFLLGANWKLCCRRLAMDRGSFFHAVYRIQQKLGRVFRELEPFALFPLDEYFGGTVRRALPKEYARGALVEVPKRRKRLAVPLVLPIAAIAEAVPEAA